MPITLVLSDPHPIVLFGLTCLLERESDIQVLAQSAHSDLAFEAVKSHAPDILLTEIDLPGCGGMALVAKIRELKLATRVVLLASQLTSDQAATALQLNVDGVVLKSMPTHLIVQCLRKVHAGGQWLEKESFSRAMEKMLRREAGVKQVASVLSPREISIVQLVAGGLRNREIGVRLFISEGTVKIHLSNVYRKLGIDSRFDLTVMAREKGLV